jgi:hypothetical protein
MTTMENNKERQLSESEQLQRQDPNPGSLAVSDEQQRQQGRESGQQYQHAPVGNEKDSEDTQGAQAGMGE